MKPGVRFVPFLAAVSFAVAACTGPAVRGHGPVARAVVNGAQAAAFPSLVGAGGTDGDGQAVTGIAAYDGTVVAVGDGTAGGVGRPLLLWSHDDGRTWRRGVVTSGAAGAAPDESALLVVVRHGHFVALGNRPGGVVAWVSADGRHWVRRPLPVAQFGGAASVAALAVTAAGFVAVGQSVDPGRRTAPLAWTSRDGRTWVRRGAPAGLHGGHGVDVRMSGVAAVGRRVVAVGSLDSGTADRERPAVWRSTDGGRRWHAVPLPRGLAGTGTRSWFSEVTAAGPGFVAIGSGGPGAPYEGVVARSADGRRWTADAGGGALARPGRQVYPTALAGDTLLGTACTTTCTLFGAARRGTRWRAVPLPVRDGQIELYDAVRTARGSLLLAGSARPAGDDDARIWRVDDGVVTRAQVAAGDRRPDVSVDGLATDGSTWLAVGRSGRRAVAWRSTDGMHFAAPQALSADPAVFVDGVDHGPAGWLVRGGRTAGSNDEAQVWSSPDARHWRHSPAGTFGRAGAFAYSQVAAATGYRGGWVVVGRRTDDGASSESALVALSTDNLHWDQDQDNRWDHLVIPVGEADDLRGGLDGTRAMTDVARLGPGLIAVGTAQRRRFAADPDPAVWISPVGQQWQLRRLPSPAGVGSAEPTTVVVRGATIAVLGTWHRGDAAGLVRWVSSDRGATWTARVVPGVGGRRMGVDVAGLVVGRTGFTALGTVTVDGVGTPQAWTSPDGRSWRIARLTDRRLRMRTDCDWELAGPLAVPDGVRVVARCTTVGGVRTFVAAQRA